MDVHLGFEEIVYTTLPIFMACPADVFDDVTLKVTQILVNDEVPDFDVAKAVVVRVVLAHWSCSKTSSSSDTFCRKDSIQGSQTVALRGMLVWR